MGISDWIRPEQLGDLPGVERELVQSFRFAILAHKHGEDPCEAMSMKLGSQDLSERLGVLIAAIGNAWTDSFHISPPCCPRLSFDEATLVAMFRLAAMGNRPEFDRLLCEMMAQDERDTLFGVLAIFTATWLSTFAHRCRSDQI